ncbi:MAG: ATPase AAA [Candidatus Magnetoglobus multicellularis str. Araruama]|uniref:ATPase AAA n=1 Tax=Candidatus Magnetoglobus multicellularis str. Araruama TaxID=890399 RepID=A0A1V1P7W1_9BACT|nr:MAG: ATPase AAA [Candidatus Magnetoglobus multicellularis str. Araruama]
MIIQREMNDSILSTVDQFPVITITGPRQSGKTTLVKSLFSDYEYYSMEDPDIREFALTDPRRFLNQKNSAIILDEVQRTPELLSYIQGIVDRKPLSTRYIITGSHQFELIHQISQSLAGRTIIFKLLPFTISELKQFVPEQSLDKFLLQGFYPGVHDRRLNATLAYKNYFETYIQKDLRELIQIKNLRLFNKFVKLCAGRIGQIFSANSLSNEVGVSVPTIQSWISILEASYIVFFLEPYYANIGKRLIKSPKIYFYDVGLASYLLGIETEIQMERDPLRGNLFENLVLMELVKKRLNKGLNHNLYFYRDSNKNEVDIVYQSSGQLIPFEIKSSETFSKHFFKGLKYFQNLFPERVKKAYLVYTGNFEKEMNNFELIHFTKISQMID